MKALILLCAVGVALAAQVCHNNAHYESCGTACPLTCSNYNDPPRVCVLMCVPGCVCDEGYVKSIDGSCVKPEHCPAIDPAPTCPSNSHYELCGTSCPLTCENYKDAPLVCDFMCNHGCFCDKGYVLAQDGSCVKPSQCPANSGLFVHCPENSVYSDCGTACPLTCDNYDNPPTACPLMCVSGCHCEKGFVKTEDGHCVRPENCPSRAVRPEKYTCVEEPEKGECRGYIPMYYYDAKDGTCKKFIYGGCGGNGNRHVTEKECLAHCEGVTQSSSDICSLPKEQGLCQAYFPRYYYDSDLGKCVRFVYGGCGGNENNFQTEEECQRTCETAPLRSFDVSSCQLFPETGPCKANIVRYYFDKNEKTCKPFIYGGCEGNGNNFETVEECNGKCNDVSKRNFDLRIRLLNHINSKNYTPRSFTDQLAITEEDMQALIFLCAVGVALAAQVCQDNAHYESCGTACPLTCSNYNNPPQACVLMCVAGCVCDEGYVKSIDGSCVKPLNCPAIDPAPSCPSNAHYEECGTSCPLTCENYANPPHICNLMCNTGCFCDEGYVKTHDGKCVKPSQCPARDPAFCPDNSEYRECGTACPLTCENYHNPPRICPAMCVSGCHCQEGFVQTQDGHCIRPENCPQRSVEPENPSCVEEPETGPCRAYIPMYYYDIKDGTCKKFIYGGCEGNGNRHPTLAHCLSLCEGVTQSTSDICSLPKEQGLCHAYFLRYHYDSKLGKCVQFVYGGCGGNENNFETEEECQRTCA
ncbi:papilin-like [Uloborus diversus]|uniref:papilin-like n=1 Tax=Uloborus diversus TaxID=327109 RepID=UPI0024098C65|nr:papilin-like [Uloborus diversus]